MLIEHVSIILLTEIFGITLWDWSIALGFSLIMFTVLQTIQSVGLRYMKKRAVVSTETRTYLILDVLKSTQIIILTIIALSMGLQWLALPEKLQHIIRLLALTAFFIQVGLWAAAFVDAWLVRYNKVHNAGNPAAATSMGIIKLAAKLVIGVCVLLSILDNYGVDVTAMVAGLGLGGIAVALAVQNILSDLFASMSIALNKPFVIGDFVTLGEHMGTVEKIGLKTTMIRSLSGEQIILANSDMLASRIRNFGRMFERRVQMAFNLTYDTPRDHLTKLPDVIRTAITSHEKTRFDRAHFKSYGPLGLEFEYVYFVLVPDYNLFMDINQAVNLAIFKYVEDNDLRFGFTGQTPIKPQAFDTKSIPDAA